MQTKTKKTVLAVFSALIATMSGFFVLPTEAANLSSNLSDFTLYESASAGPTETRFVLKLVPEPTDQVTTSYSTNGQCAIGHNFTDYTGGGAIVTKNDSLSIGLRILNDTEGEGEHSCDIRFSSVSQSDPEYANPVSIEYSILIIDDDLIVPYQYSLATLTSGNLREGENFVEQYEVSLSRTPQYDVSITASVDGQCDLLSGVPQQRVKSVTQTVSAGTTTPQRFTLIPVDDAVFEGVHTCSVQHATATQDQNYAGVVVGSYTADIVDNEINQNIPDQREYEGGVLYYLDANADGIEDSQQPQVMSFIHPFVEARQALLLVDSDGRLAQGCAFKGDVQVDSLEQTSSALVSQYGQIAVTVDCSNDTDYRILWLLEEYTETANTWDVYEATQDGTLNKVPAHSGVFKLGDAQTTSIKIDLGADGNIVFVQVEGDALQAQAGSIEESLATDIRNARLNPIAVVSAVSAVAVVAWIVYRKYFSLPNTVRSRYPRIDRF